jgi:lauroyl/myristoyl acyltransferase
MEEHVLSDDRDIKRLIEDLDKIENLIDRIIHNGDFETLPKILDQRKSILEKMVIFSSSQLIQDRVNKLLEDDKKRVEIIKPEMEKIRQLLKTTNRGKTAIKNGYMKVQDEVAKRRFNSNG